MATLCNELQPVKSSAYVALNSALGTAGRPGQVVTVGSEDMLILTGNGTTGLVVERAIRGTTIAAHAVGETVTLGTSIDYDTAEGSHVVLIAQDGAGTYSATYELPAGCYLTACTVVQLEAWDSATSAVLNVGLDNDADAIHAAFDAKAAGAGSILQMPNTAVDTYIASATDLTVSLVATGATSAGQTRVLVAWAIPGDSTTATKA